MYLIWININVQNSKFLSLITASIMKGTISKNSKLFTDKRVPLISFINYIIFHYKLLFHFVKLSFWYPLTKLFFVVNFLYGFLLDTLG